MNFSPVDYLTLENILADATLRTGDEGMRMLNKGFYMRQAKRALDELNFETFFDLRYEDLVIPKSLRIPIPSGAWNIKDMFIWNGSVMATDNVIDNQSLPSPQDITCCKISSSARVYHKDNFLTNGHNKGYTAWNKKGQLDYFACGYTFDDSTYYYNVQNGIIMLSDHCTGFPYTRIIYNGTASDIDKTKMIPPFIRQAIVLYVAKEAFAVLKQRDKAYRVDWADTNSELYVPKSRGSNSVWDDAAYRLKRIDSKHRKDLGEYLSRGSY